MRKKNLVLVALLLVLPGIAGPSALRAQEPLPKLEIVSPKDGDVITPGSVVTIQVKGGRGINNALIVAEQPLTHPADTQKPMEFLLTVQPNIKEGTYYIKAMSEAYGDYVESSEVHLNIKWPENPVSMTVEPNKLDLGSLGKTKQLAVTGTFDDGKSYDISKSQKTIYTSENPKVISVSGTGVVYSLRPGRTIIHVKNGKLERGVAVMAVSNPRYDRMDMSVTVTVLRTTIDKDGNYLIPVVVTNNSPIPLAAIGLISATLDISTNQATYVGGSNWKPMNEPALGNLPVKKGFDMKEDWAFPLTFARPLDRYGNQATLKIKGVFSATPEGSYEPKDLGYDVVVNLP